jgi:hypothetical protein
LQLPFPLIADIRIGFEIHSDRNETIFWLYTLKSVCIPSSIEAHEKNWYSGRSLVKVIFESRAPFQTMIERMEVDLSGNFDLYVIGLDGIVNFLGYSVSIIPGVDYSR